MPTEYIIFHLAPPVDYIFLRRISDVLATSKVGFLTTYTYQAYQAHEGYEADVIEDLFGQALGAKAALLAVAIVTRP